MVSIVHKKWTHLYLDMGTTIRSLCVDRWSLCRPKVFASTDGLCVDRWSLRRPMVFKNYGQTWYKISLGGCSSLSCGVSFWHRPGQLRL